jgi:hypothetical protein
VNESDRRAGFPLQGSREPKQRGDLTGDVLVDGVHTDQRVEYQQRRSIYLHCRFGRVLMSWFVQPQSIYCDDVQIKPLEVDSMDFSQRPNPFPQGFRWVLC